VTTVAEQDFASKSEQRHTEHPMHMTRLRSEGDAVDLHGARKLTGDDPLSRYTDSHAASVGK
jgi:hypothetical protein